VDVLLGMLASGLFFGPWIWLFVNGGRFRRLEAEIAELRTRLGMPPRQPDWVPPEPAAPAPTEAAEPPPAAAPEPTPAAVEPPRAPEPVPSAGSGWDVGVPPAPEPVPAAATAATASDGGPSGWAWLEQELTSRWAVWAGAVAVALGAVFLVKYSIDAGLVGPGVRVMLGVLLGVALLGASEWVRRHPIANLSQQDYVGPALSGAGVVALYVAIYAAYKWSDLIPSLAAFVLLALIAAAALIVSLLHGPFTAGLGAIGAYLVPILVSTGSRQLWGLVLYLLVVTAGNIMLLRHRAWLWLGGIVVLANGLWQLAGQTAPGPINHLMLALHALAVPVMLFALLDPGPRYAPEEPLRRWPRAFGPLDWLLFAGAVVMLLALSVLIREDGYGEIGIVTWAIAILLCLWQAWRSPRDLWLPLIAGPLTVAIAASWILAEPEAGFTAPGYWSFAVVPNATQDFLLPVAVYAALFGIGGYLLLWGSLQAGVWASLSAGIPVALLVVAYGQVMRLELSLPWALAGLALAGVNLLAAERVGRYRELPPMLSALAAYAVVALSAIALAAAMTVRDAWLSVSIAAVLPAAGWLWRRLRVDGLRWLAAIVAGVVAARLALNPFVVGYEIGPTPVFNWLLYGYGLPVVLAWLAARLFRDERDDWLTYLLQSTAMGLGFVLLTLEVVHFAEGGQFRWTNQSLLRDGMLAVGWTVLAYGQLRADRVAPHPVRSWTWRILVVLSVGWTAMVVLLVDNPVFTRQPVGELPILNLIGLAYGLPAVALLLIAFEFRRQSKPEWLTLSGAAALILGFIAVNLEVRRAFVGPVLGGPDPSQAESLAYSAAWLAYGVALLILGVWRDNHAVRYASLGVVLLTVAKVFLFDLAGLTGLYRALSFIGLGLSLIGIGYGYRRFVFSRSAAAPPPAASPSQSTPAS
jgi:uncharacterized membrane protein